MKMVGNTPPTAQLAERRRSSLALLQRYPILSREYHVELHTTPHETCGCLLWCRCLTGYRCLYCMPPLELAKELSGVLESVVEKKWKNPYADVSLETLPTPDHLQGCGSDEP